MADACQLDPESASEAVETFIVNAKYVGLLRPIAGVERLLPLEHVPDESPGRAVLPLEEGGMEVTVRRGPSGQPTARDTDWAHTCFYITPIGDEDSESRPHADVFLASIVEPAIEALVRDFTVVRADHIDRPGMITAQVIEHVFRSGLVVADLSFHNPNVFELALRHASGKPTVLISREADPLPFDVSDLGPFSSIRLTSGPLCRRWRPGGQKSRARLGARSMTPMEAPAIRSRRSSRHIGSTCADLWCQVVQIAGATSTCLRCPGNDIVFQKRDCSRFCHLSVLRAQGWGRQRSQRRRVRS